MKERPRICSYQTNRCRPRHARLTNGRPWFIGREPRRLEAAHHERQISKAHEGRRMPESRERSCQIRCASVIRLSASPAGMPPNASAGKPESTPQLQSPNAKAEAVTCHRTGLTSQAGRHSAKQSAEASDAGLKDLASGHLLFSKSITLVIAHIPIHCASAPCAVRRRRESPSIRLLPPAGCRRTSVRAAGFKEGRPPLSRSCPRGAKSKGQARIRTGAAH